LNLLCQCPGSWHETGIDGTYDVFDVAAWVHKTGPYMRVLVESFHNAPPIAWPDTGDSDRTRNAKAFQATLKLMSKLVKYRPGRKPESADASASDFAANQAAVVSSLKSLLEMLDATDPRHTWGGLHKVQTPDGHNLWLCPHHAKAFHQQEIPEAA
jgi:hypothetical protein